MALKLVLQCTFLLLLSWICTVQNKKMGKVPTGIDSSTQQAITSTAINAGEKILEFAKKFVDPQGKLLDILDKLSGFVGAFGGFLSFIMIFLPQDESAELQFMKGEFFKVNTKLDQITDELDQMADVITLEAQRSSYITAASKIKTGYEQMQIFINQIADTDTGCQTLEECYRERLTTAEHYVRYFDLKEYINQILDGAMGIAAFGEPLLELYQRTYKCDVGKIDNFAGAVLKWAFQAQQVILLHEKLTGTNATVLSSMDDWLNKVNNLRRETIRVKNECYDNMQDVMKRDIRETKYEVDYGTNLEAAEALKRDMELKYPWLYWVVISFAHTQDSDQHFVQTNTEGDFWHIPTSEEAPRTIIAVPQNKGYYFLQRTQFATAVNEILAAHIVMNPTMTETIHDKLVEGLKIRAVWRLLKSLVVLELADTDDLQVAIDDDHHLFWYNQDVEVLVVSPPSVEPPLSRRRTFRIIAIFRSDEEINFGGCVKACDAGTCIKYPYSTELYCECEDFYHGEFCESHMGFQLALDMENILQVTFRIPQLTDVSFQIEDLGTYLGASIDRMLIAAEDLGKQVKRSYDQLSNAISGGFAWLELVTLYGQHIMNLKYYMVTTDPEDHQLTPRELAGTVHRSLFEINNLILGSSELGHKSLILTKIEANSATACTTYYKNAISATWKQFVLLQHQGYIFLAQLRHTLGQSSRDVSDDYVEVIKNQIDFLQSKTCELEIPYSTNVNCTGGFYLDREMTITTQCLPDHFVYGSLVAKCPPENQSGCRPCGCSLTGSNSGECSDLDGQCVCTNNYKGTTCEDRDCEYGQWQPWSDCVDCGPGTKHRTRSIAVTKEGSGDDCVGPVAESVDCFLGCCRRHFHCEDSVCYPDSTKCDYFLDCAAKSEEADCHDTCHSDVTSLTQAHWGKMYYLEDHEVSSVAGFITEFGVETSGDWIRYTYRYCNPPKRVCFDSYRTTAFYSDGNGNLIYLDRHNVDCGEHSFINLFRLERNPEHTEVRYRYYCCVAALTTTDRYWDKITCRVLTTAETGDGGGNVNSLDRQRVACPLNYYLSQFRLRRNVKALKIYYSYKCCTYNKD